ncbi:hypothetical protein NIES4101_53760 [Calothrix sp. NIES-4101]|nr:hypothetical protein NIES4101_53760 [Calothrix sp. NIES-4101]
MEDDQSAININADTSKVKEVFAKLQDTINSPGFQEAMRVTAEEIQRTKESLVNQALTGAIFGNSEFTRRFVIDTAYRHNSIHLERSHWTETIQIEHEDDCIGDRNCINNALSRHLQCAINPTGDCSDCKHFEAREGKAIEEESFVEVRTNEGLRAWDAVNQDYLQPNSQSFGFDVSDLPGTPVIAATIEGMAATFPVSIGVESTSCPEISYTRETSYAERHIDMPPSMPRPVLYSTQTLHLRLSDRQRQDLIAMLFNHSGDCEIILNGEEMRVQ